MGKGRSVSDEKKTSLGGGGIMKVRQEKTREGRL